MTEVSVVEERKKGRRPKTGSDKRTKMVGVRMDSAEYNRLVEYAGSGGVAKFVRDASHQVVNADDHIVKGLRKPLPIPADAGVYFSMLLTPEEKETFMSTAKYHGFSLNGFFRAVSGKQLREASVGSLDCHSD